MDSLRELAVDQIRSDDAFLGKRRFTIDQQSHTLSYDLRPTPVSFVLSEADPDALALEALIRVEALRRDFTESISAEKFWSVLLDAIQQSIGRCVQFSELELQSGSHPCNKEIETKFEQLRRAIESYATEHGLRLIEASQARGPVVGYRMGIKIDPPKARVRIMTLLEYKKYKYFKTPPDEYQWSDLLESEANMIGWYHYRAEWPSELNGPEEGDIEIKQAGTVTFRPNPK